MKNYKILLLLCFSFEIFAEPIKTPQPVIFPKPIESYRNHPGDYPFPTETTFMNFADHAIVQITESFDPDLVKKGDTIFLADWYIPWFFKYVHPKIKHPYIIISNDTDGWHPDPGTITYNELQGSPPPIEATRMLLYDSKVAAWFCKNLVLSRHPKIFQIPIGQNILYWGNFKNKDLLLNLAQKDKTKSHLLYLNMQLKSHPSRPIIAALFQNEPYCFSRIKNSQHQKLSVEEFYQDLADSKFTFAPPGYGIDTVRFWESIVLDCIPIVQHYELDDLYADLPVLFVHEWEEINEQLLNDKYAEIKSKNYSDEKAYFDYWANKIKTVQNLVREDKNSFSNISKTKFSKSTLKTIKNLITKHFKDQDNLLCKGAVLGLRPLQIAKKCPSIKNIYLSDKWGALTHEQPAAQLEGYYSGSLLAFKDKLKPISFWDNPYLGKMHVFLDLTYLRHNLFQDLEEALQKTKHPFLIFGNCASDRYVKEVLEKAAKKHPIKIHYDSEIWYITRRSVYETL